MSDAQLLISTRKRVVWTLTEKKALDRAARFMNQHGDKMLLWCGSQVCPDQKISIAEQATGYKGRVLRCGCTDRVVEDTF